MELTKSNTFNVFSLKQNTHQIKISKSEYDQEIPQSQTADQPTAPDHCNSFLAHQVRFS